MFGLIAASIAPGLVILGRFIQADDFVEPEATQGLNRYSYVLNNPLSATDPTGNFSLRQGLALVVAVVAAYFGQYWLSQKLLGYAFLTVVAGGFLSGAIATGTLKGALWGAASAAAFFGIGSYFQGVAGGNLTASAEAVQSGGKAMNLMKSGLTSGQTLAKIAAHAGAGGTLNVLQGGKFGHGFVAAGFTEALSPAVGQLGEGRDFGTVLAKTAASAAIGGTASKLSGGSFANGAQTGAFQQLFNHVATSVTKSTGDGALDGATAEKARGAVDMLWFNPNDPGDSTFFKSLSNWTRNEGEFILAAHGNSDHIEDRSDGRGSIYYFAKEASYEIEAHPRFAAATSVRLLSCNTGLGNLASFAQDLANHLGKPVIAPTAYVFFKPNGRIFAGAANTIGGKYVFSGTYKEWKTFQPIRKSGP